MFTEFRATHEGKSLDHVLPSIRIGICGSPGAGKSSLIEKFGVHLVKDLDLNLAVLTIDPSSKRTGGSILGDKTRMDLLCQEEKAFIRPSPTSGHLGGIALNTNEIVTLMEHVGFDATIVETVGVGQSEVAIDDIVDFVIYVVPPGSGDDLQAAKKGVMEIADVVLISKYDSEFKRACKILKVNIQGAMHFSMPKIEGWTVPVEMISAHTGFHIEKIWEIAMKFKEEQKDYIREKRRQQLKNSLWNYLGPMITTKLKETPTDALVNIQDQLVEQRLTPHEAATHVIDNLLKDSLKRRE